jgi:hypothetical protein
MTRSCPHFLLSFLVLAACGGGGGGSHDDLPCPSGDCGNPAFRRAVPTAARLHIKDPTGAPAKRSGSSQLDGISDALISVDDQVGEINDLIEGVFDDLDETASTTPEIETATENTWRYELVDDPGLEEVLRITSDDGVHFTIEDFVGPAGLEPDGAAPVLHGEVTTDDDGATDFNLTVDLDAWAAATGEAAQGEVVIAVMPLDGGDDEIWYDYHEVAFDGEPAESSRTTAWIWDADAGSIGLEYLADVDGELVTVYARWDDAGGRYDHHVATDDPESGPIDEIATNCWGAGGEETFDAFAVIDSSGAHYGELDGDEESCEFGPVADHPSPGDDFDDLPGDGEWSELELGDVCQILECE